MKKGRPKGFSDKKEIHLTISKSMLRRVDECRKVTGVQRTRSEFVESVLEMSLYSEKAYASYMMRQKKLEAAWWQWQFEKHEEGEKMKIEYERQEVLHG